MAAEECNKRYLELLKQIKVQEYRAELLRKKREELTKTNEAILVEKTIKTTDLTSMNEINARLKALSEDLKAKEEEEMKRSGNSDKVPSVQEMFADQVKGIQDRLDAHAIKSKDISDENNELRTEFRQLLLEHDNKNTE